MAWRSGLDISWIIWYAHFFSIYFLTQAYGLNPLIRDQIQTFLGKKKEQPSSRRVT